MKNIKVTLNRLIYIGFSNLEISKLLMYDFHYNYIRARYGARAQLLFIDTDSLPYRIETEDLTMIWRQSRTDLTLVPILVLTSVFQTKIRKSLVK